MLRLGRAVSDMSAGCWVMGLLGRTLLDDLGLASIELEPALLPPASWLESGV